MISKILTLSSLPLLAIADLSDIYDAGLINNEIFINPEALTSVHIVGGSGTNAYFYTSTIPFDDYTGISSSYNFEGYQKHEENSQIVTVSQYKVRKEQKLNIDLPLTFGSGNSHLNTLSLSDLYFSAVYNAKMYDNTFVSVHFTTTTFGESNDNKGNKNDHKMLSKYFAIFINDIVTDRSKVPKINMKDTEIEISKRLYDDKIFYDYLQSKSLNPVSYPLYDLGKNIDFVDEDNFWIGGSFTPIFLMSRQSDNSWEITDHIIFEETYTGYSCPCNNDDSNSDKGTHGIDQFVYQNSNVYKHMKNDHVVFVTRRIMHKDEDNFPGKPFIYVGYIDNLQNGEFQEISQIIDIFHENYQTTSPTMMNNIKISTVNQYLYFSASHYEPESETLDGEQPDDFFGNYDTVHSVWIYEYDKKTLEYVFVQRYDIGNDMSNPIVLEITSQYILFQDAELATANYRSQNTGALQLHPINKDGTISSTDVIRIDETLTQTIDDDTRSYTVLSGKLWGAKQDKLLTVEWNIPETGKNDIYFIVRDIADLSKQYSIDVGRTIDFSNTTCDCVNAEYECSENGVIVGGVLGGVAVVGLGSYVLYLFMQRQSSYSSIKG